MLALTVRTYYMPNEDWQSICQRGRALRDAAGTLTGHAAGQDTTPVLDHTTAVKALGVSAGQSRSGWSSAELPEPLASVVDYLGDDLEPDGREFIPTAELTDALDVEPSVFARQMGELGCRPTRNRIPTEDGGVRRVRGYFTADLRVAIDRTVADEIGSATDAGTDQP